MSDRRFLTAATFLTLLAAFVLMSTGLRAQTCTLEPPFPTRLVSGMSATSFLPNGQDGQLVVRKASQDGSAGAGVAIPAFWGTLGSIK